MGIDMEVDLVTDAAKAEAELSNILWNYIPRQSKEFAHIPEVQPQLVENDAMIDNYLLGKTIGNGKHAVVRKCSHTRNGMTNLAVKIIHKDTVKSLAGLKRIETELKALKLLSLQSTAKNVTYFMDCLHSERYLYIVMERMQFDLYEFMDCYQEAMDTNVISVILTGVCTALQHMHSISIAHNDIKPENVLLSVTPGQLTVKLCDLGNAWMSQQLRPRDHVGTSGFMAPECIVQEKYCSYAADIFSLGCVALEMLINESLFSSVWMACYSEYLIATPALFSVTISKAISIGQRQIEIKLGYEESQSLIQCLEFDPLCRPSLQSILSSPCLKNSSMEAAMKLLVTDLSPEECSQPPSPKSAMALVCSEDLFVDLCVEECVVSVSNVIPVLEQLQQAAPPLPSRTRRPAMLNQALPPCGKQSASVPTLLFSQTATRNTVKPKRHSTPTTTPRISSSLTPRSVSFISSTTSSQYKQLRRITDDTNMSKTKLLY